MSLHDQEAFLKSIHPFELLTHKELTKAVNSMDIAYYKKDEVLISPDNISEFLYLIIKGEVGEYHKDELIKVYHNSNTFDADSLIYDKTEDTFTVLEELICFEMKKEDFKSLLDSNNAFKEFYISDLANKIQSAKQKEYTTQMSGFMIARIVDSYLHAPCIVKTDVSIMDALHKMEKLKTNCILVQDGDECGIVTDSILRKHILYNDYDKNGPIGPIALKPIITMEHDDFLFNALLSFTKNSIKRIIITKDGEILGVLEQLDLLSYFANHTYLVAVQIKKATSIDELKLASHDFINIIKKLHAKGTKVEYISKLIAELNEKIYEKLYEMIVPKELAKDACLIVMGSEGRKEQMLKTDQDNALIIRNGVDVALYEEYMKEFTKILIEFGFPECEGNIMVSNEYWRKSSHDFEHEILRWLEAPNKDDYMKLAIFFDSIAVAGDEKLIDELKDIIYENIKDKDVFLANFAKAALIFETPIGMFTKLISTNDQIDMKKGGIFPIVQGIRSLALEAGIRETNTNNRIRLLAKANILDKKFADVIEEAFDTLLNLRLKERLRAIGHEEDANNFIYVQNLNQLEADLLKDSFKIVNKFKNFLSHHFKISMVG
ncbi:putative nucleotidyltransferase substrate binding domain-containing protein [Sulfurimonas sp.]|uniref:putative nucleotidyltransferase substrate binding domain-containing protein n=1 Tax=Sulfurimonas sp. TaxID=2022749 RepID=UPI002AAFD46A|nr:putative nucleotidyltransferase substrate binding domain-containing protein [Sulfurimonas sp.]